VLSENDDGLLGFAIARVVVKLVSKPLHKLACPPRERIPLVRIVLQ
jgi:hypothetical protein